MSGPSNYQTPRSSTSSQPSVTSSSTLSTRYSGFHLEPGGPSSPNGRADRGSRRLSDKDGDYASEQPGIGQNGNGYLGDALVEKSRRYRPRRSGGFLLESALPSSPDAAVFGEHVEPRQNDPKGKGRRDDDRLHVEKRRSTRHRLSGHGSSPLAREITRAAPTSGGVDVEDREDLQTSVPLSTADRNASFEPDGEDSGLHRRRAPGGLSAYGTSPRAPALNPADLVNMALNLNESRRRNFSAGMLASPPTANTRRVTSAGLPPQGLGLQGSYLGHNGGGSLKFHLQQQRRMSRNLSPRSGRVASYSPRDTSPTAIPEPAALLQEEIEIEYQFSTATLTRAEKARTYFELSSEYRRLLKFLPPLKPDSSALGNSTFTTLSTPGSAHVQMSRVTSHQDRKYELGRQYNPLQFLRNRKVRARERQTLDCDTAGWNNTAKVLAWVDAVEEQAERPEYRVEVDSVSLPPFGINYTEDEDSQFPSPKGHRRTDTVTSKAKGPRMNWIIHASDLLADAFWLEQGDNKYLIEDRHGNKIFPSKGRRSYTGSRASVEQPRDPDTRSKSVVSAVGTGPPRESPTGDGSDNDSFRGRRKLHLLTIHRGGSAARVKRRSWNKVRRGSGSSSSLSSSDDARSHDRASFDRRVISENTGPLERQMQEMLAKEEQESRSPQLISPDKWDSAHTSLEHTLASKNQSRNGDNDADPPIIAVVQHPPSEPNSPPDNIASGSEKPRSSFEDLDSTAPNSPANAHHVPGININLSPPTSRKTSPVRKSRKLKLGMFRSDNKAKHNIEQTDFALSNSSQGSSKQPIGETAEPSRSSLDGTRRPDFIKRHRTTESLTGSVEHSTNSNHKDGKDATDTRDAGSAVTRFLKGGRIGELVRNEGSRMGDFVWKKDSSADDAMASYASLGLPDSSDTDDNEARSKTLKKRPNPLSRSTASYEDKTEEERGRTKPKYHMNNLPTFKPASNFKRHSPSVSPGKKDDDHILRQQLAQRDQRRPSRFERLAPPGLDLSNISPSSPSPDLARVYSQTTNDSTIDDRRNSYGFTISRSRSRNNHRLGFPGEVGRKGPAMSGLAGLGVSAHSGPSRPGLKGKRHWSISDRAPQVQHAAVTQHDIAHVRALLLSSGIKAREINRRAHSVRSPAPPFLLKASQTARKPLYPVARKEEHVLAARLLSTDLAAATTAFEAALTRFRNATAPRVSGRLSALHELVVEDLTPRVHRCADDADAFTAEMTTSYTLAIKQVNDSVDLMLRTRRRRLKWIRKVGFVLLEWLLLGVMWCVWLLFVLVRMVKGVVVGFARGVAWVLWL